MTVALDATLRTHRLDIVAVRVDQERGEIGRAVIGPRPGGAIVTAAGFRALAVKFSDRGVIGGAKRNVGAGDRPVVPIEPQRRLALGSKSRAVVVAGAQDIAER